MRSLLGEHCGHDNALSTTRRPRASSISIRRSVEFAVALSDEAAATARPQLPDKVSLGFSPVRCQGSPPSYQQRISCIARSPQRGAAWTGSPAPSPPTPPPTLRPRSRKSLDKSPQPRHFSVWEWGRECRSHRGDRWVVAYGFTMHNGSELVRCSISSVAMDELSGRWKGRSATRDEQFHEFRAAIEFMASSLFDNGVLDRRTIRIFAKHFPFQKR